MLWLNERRRTPLQAQEALGPISISRGSRGVLSNNKENGTFTWPAWVQIIYVPIR